MSMKNSDTIGNRSRDLPVCSTVPQPLRYRVPPTGAQCRDIFRPLRRLSQYPAPILLCFPRHWALISAGSCSTAWWWHFKVPKHVWEYLVPIHWIINAFVGFLFTFTSSVRYLCIYVCMYVCMYVWISFSYTYFLKTATIHTCYMVAVSKSSLPFITQSLRSTEEKIPYSLRHRFLSIQLVERKRIKKIDVRRKCMHYANYINVHCSIFERTVKFMFSYSSAKEIVRIKRRI
jgi:hypothetical protein